MNIAFAPMEGLTDSVYRRLHHRYFPGTDRYFMPFFSPTIHRQLTPREARELPPAQTESFLAIPQILTKSAEDFLWAAQQCADLGYQEVNLNLGCPSGTVFSKGKGSGMLKNPQELSAFLERIYANSALPVSIKTRLGVAEPEEFEALLAVFNQYPVKELILHPRVRKAFYEGSVQMDWFGYAVTHSKHPLCYNGNLCKISDLEAFESAYPQIHHVMLGRGLIGDPGMLTPGGTRPDALEAFLDELLETYIQLFGGSRNAMFRLKENWRYLLCRFENAEKAGKRLRKTTDVDEYRAITHDIIRNHKMRDALEADW